MFRLRFVLTILLMFVSTVIFAQQVTSLAIFVPTTQNLPADQAHLPLIIQGELVSSISKYSNISVLDRQRLEAVLRENESGIYRNDAELAQLGEITNTEYHLVGSITQAGQNFVLQLNVVDARRNSGGRTRASFSGNVTINDLNNLTAVRKASLELLTGMGVTLSEFTRRELSGAGTTDQVNAQAALAQGIRAQRRGTEVEALSYYIQARNFDPSLAEAASRVNILSANISSGNIGEDARNDIAWRRQWVERLQETEAFYRNYRRQRPPPYYLVYSTAITRGNINYQNETIALSIMLNSLPAEPAWFETINQVMYTVTSGLQATHRTSVWGLDWPSKCISTPNPFTYDERSYAVVVDLLNAGGKRIASQTVQMPFSILISDSRFQYQSPSFSVNTTVNFPSVSANDITDNLTIRISSINGIPTEQAVNRLLISVLPEAEYNRIESVIANGLDLINLQRFVIRNNATRGRGLVLHSYNTHIDNVIIPYGVVTILNGSFPAHRKLNSITIPPSVFRIERSAFINPLPLINIGANVNMESNSFNNNFSTFYNSNNKRAGIYEYSGTWRRQPQSQAEIVEDQARIEREAAETQARLERERAESRTRIEREAAERQARIERERQAIEAQYTVSNGTITKFQRLNSNQRNSRRNEPFVIPGVINGVIITAIGEKAFYGEDLEDIVIPPSVTSIGKEAFGPFNNIIFSITIGANVRIHSTSFFRFFGVTSFKTFYDRNRKQAGVYIFEEVDDGKFRWIFSPR